MANWDRPDDRARAGPHWSPTDGARGHCRACRGRPCRVRRNRGRRARPCRGHHPCCGRPCCDRTCRGGCHVAALALDALARRTVLTHFSRRRALSSSRRSSRGIRRRALAAALRNRRCGGHGDGAARAARRRRLRRWLRLLRLRPGGRDGAGGCGRDADGVPRNGRRAARLRRVQARPASRISFQAWLQRQRLRRQRLPRQRASARGSFARVSGLGRSFRRRCALPTPAVPEACPHRGFRRHGLDDCGLDHSRRLFARDGHRRDVGQQRSRRRGLARTTGTSAATSSAGVSDVASASRHSLPPAASQRTTVSTTTSGAGFGGSGARLSMR